MNFRLILLTLISLLSNQIVSYGQCENNLIKNGSFEIDSIGEGVTGTHWITLSGSPDLDNNIDSLNAFGAAWNGKVQESFNLGNWQNIGYRALNGDTLSEGIGQIVLLEKSIPHKLKFEFASQIYGGNALNRTWFSALDIIIENEIVFTTHLDTTIHTWEIVEFEFTPPKSEIFIEIRINPDLNKEPFKYVAIDGFCLYPIKIGMFCK